MELDRQETPSFWNWLQFLHSTSKTSPAQLKPANLWSQATSKGKVEAPRRAKSHTTHALRSDGKQDEAQRHYYPNTDAVPVLIPTSPTCTVFPSLPEGLVQGLQLMVRSVTIFLPSIRNIHIPFGKKLLRKLLSAPELRRVPILFRMRRKTPARNPPSRLQLQG